MAKNTQRRQGPARDDVRFLVLCNISLFIQTILFFLIQSWAARVIHYLCLKELKLDAMISLPLPSETERLIELLSEQEKKTLSMIIQAFVAQPTSNNFPDISLPGSALSPDDLEKLAAGMEADQNFLSEERSEAYLAQLKTTWSKAKP